jgi:hypothetical protein
VPSDAMGNEPHPTSSAAARPPTVALFPTAVVPVTPEVGRFERYDDEVPHTGADVALAARAAVPLHGLVGLDPPDLDRSELTVPVADQPNSAQATRATITTSPATTMT